jgi:hypothetical protein
VANTKISELSNAGALNGTEVLPIVQGNATVKTTTQNIANLLGINYTPENVANKSTDTALSQNSDTLYPSQRAIKTYVDSTVVSAITDNGNWDASSGFFPNVNAQNQPIQKGDLWYISVAGTLGGNSVLPGYSIRALVNNPAQNATNWGIINVGYGFTPENVANKSANTSLGTSDTLYPTQNAVKTYVTNALSSVSAPTLQAVTTAGATTTSNIVVNQVSTSSGASVQSSGRLIAKDIELRPTIGSSTNTLVFDSSLITGNRTYTLPNANGTVALLSSISATSPLSYSSSTGVISLPQATSSVSGFLSSTDWTAFNGKQNVTANLTSLSGLTYSSTSFVRMTGVNTFTLDTNTYATTASLSNYLPLSGGTLTGSLTLGSYGLGFSSLAIDEWNSQTFQFSTVSGDKALLEIQTGAISTLIFPDTNGTLLINVATSSGSLTTTTSGSVTIPDASASVVGLVNTGSQTFAGSKAFNSVVSVGTSTPSATAKLQVDSTTQGFLPPRMTQAQRVAITSPATGLMVYQTDSGGDGEGVYVKRSDSWFKLSWYIP